MKNFDLGGLMDDAGLTAITEFAANLCDAPIALVSFVESDRQWFPARTGLEVTETPREISFCVHAMQSRDIMVVPDATTDPRFRENPLVLGDPHIRFYAGAPLAAEDGTQIGALCVIDTAPRDGLTAIQHEGLTVMAANIMTMLGLRRSTNLTNRDRDEQESKFRILADTMPQMVWSTLPDGFHDYYNARWYEFTGVPVGSTDGEAWNGMFHPDDQEHAWKLWHHCLATGEPYQIEYRLRHHSGEYRWTLGRALPIRNKAGQIIRWFGTCTDIHETKQVAEEREIVAHELSHRIKNIFSVLNGIISLSARSYPDLKPLAEELRQRIVAMGKAHDFVRPHSAASRPRASQSSLRALVELLLAPHVGGDAERFRFIGDDATIDDAAATPLALLFHELATNAAKYGALASPGGQVTVEVAAAGEEYSMVWREVGGAPLRGEPPKEGFGSRLVKLSVEGQLSGKLERRWLAEGLEVSFSVPAAQLNRSVSLRQ